MDFLSCNRRLVFTPSPFSEEQRNRMFLLSCNLRPKGDRTLAPLKPQFIVLSTTSSPPKPERITIESDLKELLGQSNLKPKNIKIMKETFDDGKHHFLLPVGRLLSTYWMTVIPALLIVVYFHRNYILTNLPAFLGCLTANAFRIIVLIMTAGVLYDALASGPQVRTIEKTTYVVEEASIKETKD